ncbi:CaiB/BaiF CoA transferase family protein [Mesorhizobium sp. ZC-5]|uniref:CaiB/BaiF CoA transferase family protein n=1 Tax=Mesorhizobium sp. ZC-5 TaxID=2986066 RepID=UPI0021E706A3|nr:CoA transferase [Mesorhizobium sp. ZC-5]MCV3242681.1 CoA transferase [Mesorhizobium sp. ZC-5]
MTEPKILDGVVVTEIGSRTGASLCGSLLAQLGATVIFVELPNADSGSGKARHRSQLAAGKLSLLLRDDAHDRRLLEAALLRSDIVLTSSDADPSPLHVEPPSAPGNVVCDLTAFGASGPMSGQPFSELQIQALSGIMDTTGFPDGPPIPNAVPIADVLAGTYCTTAVLAAHRVRRLQGVGQAIDMALFDCAFSALGSFLSSVLTTEEGTKSRLGNRHPTVAPWNLYRSSDGWVLICAGNLGQWERLCALMGRPDLSATFISQAQRIEHIVEIDQLIEAWTQRQTTAESVRLLIDATVACGPIAPIETFPREENLDYRRMVHEIEDTDSSRKVFVPGSPLRMNVSNGVAPTRIPKPDEDRDRIEHLFSVRSSLPSVPWSSKPRRPLEGVRIIEIGQYTTAPLCARQLAHLGAEVIKVEQPGGDESRTWVPHLNGRSVSFRLNNADKRSLVLDLRSPFGISALRKLLGTADILVENLKPGTLRKFGLSPEAILELNPRLVYCSITGFGADSLYARRPAFDMVIQAMSGFMSAVSAGPVPLKSGISTADTMGAEMAMTAVLGALEFRDRTGMGQYIDLSMQDICAWLTQTAWNGAGAVQPPSALIACTDGYVLLSPGETAGQTVPRQTIDPQLADEMNVLSRTEATSRLAALGMDAVPVLSVRESSLLPQTKHRRLWFTMAEAGVEWPLLSSPIRLTGTPPRISHLAPAVDADGDSILRELDLARPSERDPGPAKGLVV